MAGQPCPKPSPAGGAAPGVFDGQTLVDFTPGRVNAVAMFDPDGDGPAAPVSGKFDRAGNAAATNLAAWDGREWRGVGVDAEEVLSLVSAEENGMPVLVRGDAQGNRC